MTATVLRGLLLDVGGPVLRLPFELLDDIERAYGLPPGHITWRGPLSPESDPLWADCEAGRISEREYWTVRAGEVERHAGRTGGVREFMASCYLSAGASAVRPETVALVADARAAGIAVGALSNDLGWLLPPAYLDTLSVLSELDAFVDLSYDDVLKPDPKAYAAAVDALALPPAEMLFVDDQPRNVAGAQAAGLHALPFCMTDVAESVRRVRAQLSLPTLTLA